MLLRNSLIHRMRDSLFLVFQLRCLILLWNTISVKKGRPTREELGRLAAQIEKWKPLGRQLDFDDASLTGFDRDHSEYREKVYAMLSEWKQRGGAKNATYQILYDALCDELVACRDLAERFCCQEK